jgi:hypothetical protein
MGPVINGRPNAVRTADQLVHTEATQRIAD